MSSISLLLGSYSQVLSCTSHQDWRWIHDRPHCTQLAKQLVKGPPSDQVKIDRRHNRRTRHAARATNQDGSCWDVSSNRVYDLIDFFERDGMRVADGYLEISDTLTSNLNLLLANAHHRAYPHRVNFRKLPRGTNVPNEKALKRGSSSPHRYFCLLSTLNFLSFHASRPCV